MVLRVYALLAGLAVVFAAVGLFQWATHEVFWNNKVRIGNAYHSELFFRVNSLFWDPSIYGRFLVVAILATLVPVLYGLSGRLSGGDRRHRVRVARPARVVLAVELRRAGRRHADRGGVRLAPARDRGHRRDAQSWRSWSRSPSRPRATRLNQGLEPRDERPLGPGHDGAPHRARPPARGRRARRFQARVRRADGRAREGAEGGRVAQHSGDRRGRDRDRGAGAARAGCSSPACWPRSACRGRASAGRSRWSPARRSPRSACTASSTTRSSRTR